MKTAEKFGHRHGNRYPWDQWFARSGAVPITLYQGRDFSADCLPSSLGVMFRVRMRARQLRRTIHVAAKSVTVGPPVAEFQTRGPKRKAG